VEDQGHAAPAQAQTLHEAAGEQVTAIRGLKPREACLQRLLGERGWCRHELLDLLFVNELARTELPASGKCGWPLFV
ncbi:MAG TPA: hypothetical protein DCL54_17790, partial [Alphaproteobacteria bacterium]|nr:hypothetical protein [Alphaproteobacteria bacterium]